MLKNFISPGMRRGLKMVESELAVQARHSRACKLSRIYLERRPLKLNCGSGAHLKPGWVNIDLSDQADLQLDLRRPMPFKDNSVELIYSEHFLEHLDYPDDTLTFLRESWRVLIPGGTLHIGIPDTDLAVKAYASGDHRFFQHHAEGFLPQWCDTPMHWLNMHFAGGGVGGHRYGWNLETLANALNKVGFVSIQKRAFDPSLDSEYRRDVTLYVEARKP